MHNYVLKFQNMFLAIINDTYSEVKAEEFERNKVHLGFYIKYLLLKLWQFCPDRLRKRVRKVVPRANADEEDTKHEEKKDTERYIHFKK